MPLRLRSAGGGGVTLKPPVALSTEAAIEVPAYDGAKMLTNKTPGAVLQVVQSVLTSTWATNSTTFQQFLQATITPYFASSKILVMFDVAGGGNASTATLFQLQRNSSPIYSGDAASGHPQGLSQVYTGSDYHMFRTAGQYLDAPATTSGVTYALAALSSGSAAYATVNRTNADRASTSYDIRGASSLTLMEIAA